MDTIRLCLITPEFLPIWGGVGTYVVELVRHLPKDIEVHVVTPNREGFGREKVSSSDYDFAEYFGNNVRVHFVCRATDTFFYNARFQSACLKYVPELIKEERVDLVHFGHHMAGLLLELEGFSIPTVTTVHNTFQQQREGTKMSRMAFGDLEFSEKAEYLTYPLLHLAEIIYFLKARNYITVSEWMKRQLRNQYLKVNYCPIFVTHNSVDTKLFSPSKEEKPPGRDIILFTGRMIAAKGIRYLVEAIPRVLREYPEALFVFIGSGNYLPYQRWLKDMGISEKNFAFLGYLKTWNELIKYYRACSIYVAPTTLWENLPIRVLEAMACGAPVIASNICALPEVIDSGLDGILIPSGSVSELADSICTLLSDRSLRRNIGDNARKKILKKFDWNVNAIRTVEVYESILGRD
jgi:glycosyltransferase involved in cell wall biosynthesis